MFTLRCSHLYYSKKIFRIGKTIPEGFLEIDLQVSQNGTLCLMLKESSDINSPTLADVLFDIAGAPKIHNSNGMNRWISLNSPKVSTADLLKALPVLREGELFEVS
jgi:hypothetical protein